MSFARLSPVALRNLDNAHLQTLEERGRDAFSRAQHSALCLPRDASYSSTWRDAADLAGAHIYTLDSPAQARLVPYVANYTFIEVHLDHLAWARLLRDKVHLLTLAECRLDTVIAIARAMFAHPGMTVDYNALQIYNTSGTDDEFACHYRTSGFLPDMTDQAKALSPGALAGFTVDVRNTDDKSAWRELVNF